MLGGYDPYFAGSGEYSLELDEDDCCGNDEHDVVEFGRARILKFSRKKRTTTQKIIHDPTAKKVVWQLGMVFKDVNEFRRAVTKYAIRKRVPMEKWVNELKRVRVRCKDNCLWLLYVGFDKTTNDFMIKTYIPKHACNKTTKNYLYNAKFLVETFRERIIEQPNIRVFKFQELIIKKFKLYVGTTTARRTRAKVLKDIMGDHVVEFGGIIDYNDELLRTNPGISCVVKLGEADAAGQLLVVVAKNENNQMPSLAWELVEKENTNTWIWFVRCIRDDLGLGEGEGLTLITDMQKGLFATLDEVLPQFEHRRCLKGIPCAYVVAAVLFKKYLLYNYIDSCYSKETYLRTYVNVLEPVTNMKIWPISLNIIVAPPEITSFLGRPSKARRKEAGETMKLEKLPRTRLEMTCNLFHIRGHNKRGRPQSAPSAEPNAPLVTTPTGSGRGRGNQR
ncbi:uncharacterized protein LOC107865085 [Capsicum annuum]|uniref:uncharacterized protein LOC107865085 n=1 Tax=Capsicum annuum TaxID=4072 RepID=UPI0007BFDBD8|nr:uncharacterized protein LOC107865085 [Capsicum annuum]